MTFTKIALTAATLFIAGSAIAGEVPAGFDHNKCKADYPKASLVNEETGVTVMSFLVSADGSVVESKLDKSSGYKNLDKAAMKAVSACKFKPGSKDGAPAQTWATVNYTWAL
jgi:protein TonB